MNFARCEGCRRIASVNPGAQMQSPGHGRDELSVAPGLRRPEPPSPPVASVRSPPSPPVASVRSPPSPPVASVRCWPRVRQPRRVKVNRHPRHTRQLCRSPRGPPYRAVGRPPRHGKTEVPDRESELCRERFDGHSGQGRSSAQPFRLVTGWGRAASGPGWAGNTLVGGHVFHPTAIQHPQKGIALFPASRSVREPLRRVVVAATAGRPPDPARDDRKPARRGAGSARAEGDCRAILQRRSSDASIPAASADRDTRQRRPGNPRARDALRHVRGTPDTCFRATIRGRVDALGDIVLYLISWMG
jgi:hypothetical protein